MKTTLLRDYLVASDSESDNYYDENINSDESDDLGARTLLLVLNASKMR